MDKVFDPLRKKQVALTPEERVRQWFISVLHDAMQVPYAMMNSEVSLQWGDKKMRSDIVVFARDLRPMMVVECKRPDVELTREVADQIFRYNYVMDVPFVVATNGQNTYIGKRNAEGGEILSEAPSFTQMLEEYERYHNGRVSEP